MSFGFGFGSGLAALKAAQLGMQTAGNNVANANTPGYSRQRVELGTALSYGIGGNLQIGSGVDVNGISRLVDEGLERRLQFQLGLVGAAELDDMRYREIESIFAEPDEGLSNSFKDLFGSLDQLRTDPSDRALRGGLIQAGSTMSQQFNLISQRLGDLGGSTFDEVRGLTRQVNQRTQAIARLNEQIISAEANGSDANDLRDTRSQHVKELGKLLDTRAIERSSGSVDLLVGGNLVVAGGRATELRVGKNSAGTTELYVGDNRAPSQVNEGRIAALIRQEQGGLPGFTSRLDELARSTILEWNRLHSTGMPASGPFQSLVASYGAVDGDGDGVIGDELLAQAGFAFPVEQGELYVSVTNTQTGELERTRIDIDPNTMTLEDFASEVSAIDHISASIDPTGRLRISSDSGYGFDFSPQLDPNPDGGTFGGINPTIGSTAAEPYDLSGQTFPVSFDVTTGTASSPTLTTVTLDATDFANPGAATADELAAAINNDLGTAATASSVGGRLVIQSNQGGNTSELTLTNGGAGAVLTDLGLSTTTAIGRDNPIEVSIEGSYEGLDNQQFTFVPEGDGTIGLSPNLRVRVLDENGQLVTTLDVGREYEPGEPIALGNGIRVSFGAGDISATDGQVFALDALADSDTSDILVATGMNAFFLGSSAADIRVNESLLGNPDRLAAGLGAATGDAGNLSRMIGLRDRDLSQLDSNTIEDFYADLVGDIGFETSAARSALDAQNQLLGQLEADRESVSGVNIDEEMVDLLKYQQSYEAAARFISVAQEMTDVLINLGR
ncbi:MAG: flagellar hook-associated protein FlgK [Planctomycetota bacterium]